MTTVLEKLADYKQRMEVRKNEIYALIDYLEDEIKRLEGELEIAENRHVLENTEATATEIKTLQAEIDEKNADLKIQYRFVANLNHPEKMYLKLTPEEETALLAELNALNANANQEKVNFIEASQSLVTAYGNFMDVYNQCEVATDSAYALMLETTGRQFARSTLVKADRSYVGSISEVVGNLRSELVDPLHYRTQMG